MIIIDGLIPLNPQTYLFLGLPNNDIPKRVSWLVLHILTVARCLIRARWKSALLPTLTNLDDRYSRVRNSLILSARLHNTLGKFDAISGSYEMRPLGRESNPLCSTAESLWRLGMLSHPYISPFPSPLSLSQFSGFAHVLDFTLLH